MFRIVGLMCLITMTGETTCTTHYRDDFKTWPTHELCMPHAEAALEETINTLKLFGTDYRSLQVGCESVTKEQLEKEIKKFEEENDDTI